MYVSMFMCPCMYASMFLCACGRRLRADSDCGSLEAVRKSEIVSHWVLGLTNVIWEIHYKIKIILAKNVIKSAHKLLFISIYISIWIWNCRILYPRLASVILGHVFPWCLGCELSFRPENSWTFIGFLFTLPAYKCALLGFFFPVVIPATCLHVYFLEKFETGPYCVSNVDFSYLYL